VARWQDYVMRDIAANRPAANSVAVGTLYYSTDVPTLERSDGSSWETMDGAGSGSIPETILDDVGDLISATAADTPARLAVGTDGQVLTADSGEATGLIWADASSGSGFILPGGRLTLATATPVMIAGVSAATSIYYTPFIYGRISLYDGVNFVDTAFTELTNTTTDATKNPAAVTTNSNYDLFVWNDAGTIRLGRGPLWTSDTARGSGAGTTELVRVSGVWLNAVDIANGPEAQRGTYVGTVRSNGTSTIDVLFGGDGAGGSPVFLGVWNAYNRQTVNGYVHDSTDTWIYSTATFRSWNNSISNRASFVRGLNENPVRLQFAYAASNSTSGQNMVGGIDLDGTTVDDSQVRLGISSAVANISLMALAVYNAVPGLGFHFLQLLEKGSGSGTTTWYGDAGAPTIARSGADFTSMM
jgi:hypothetical protein